MHDMPIMIIARHNMIIMVYNITALRSIGVCDTCSTELQHNIVANICSNTLQTQHLEHNYAYHNHNMEDYNTIIDKTIILCITQGCVV